LKSIIGVYRLLAFLILALSPLAINGQTPSTRRALEPVPEPAIPAILAAFDKYQIVGMPAAHGMKDVDDFIYSLIRVPAFSEKVNDLAVECGNALYQPVLDRYIAGKDVPFNEVRKVWRNTTQPMCGTSGFFEQLFPLVRAINQKLPEGKRLRVLACDSPINWEQIKTLQDILDTVHRDRDIASVIEKEVLSKHRKALMLFGTFHLMHGVEGNAVSIYEKDFPNVTFVISDLGYFGTDLPTLADGPLVSWAIPSLALTKGTWLGAYGLGQFLPPPMMMNKDECIIHQDFPEKLRKPMEKLVDAFLYLGPTDLRLTEQMPADIALDGDYRVELQRRDNLPGMPGAADKPVSMTEANQEIVNGAGNPLFVIPKAPPADPEFEKKAVQSCLDAKARNTPPR
jgi:hypothetical protein